MRYQRISKVIGYGKTSIPVAGCLIDKTTDVLSWVVSFMISFAVLDW
jgi:hypothetical protein